MKEQPVQPALPPVQGPSPELKRRMEALRLLPRPSLESIRQYATAAQARAEFLRAEARNHTDGGKGASTRT